MLKKLGEDWDRNGNHRFQRSSGQKKKIKVHLEIVSVYRYSASCSLTQEEKQNRLFSGGKQKDS